MVLEKKHYYEQRAEAEIKLAQSATDERAVSAHYQLACAYLDAIYPAAETTPDEPE
jgi:hypothetical protein